jgi:hypothetical protein
VVTGPQLVEAAFLSAFFSAGFVSLADESDELEESLLDDELSLLDSEALDDELLLEEVLRVSVL